MNDRSGKIEWGMGEFLIGMTAFALLGLLMVPLLARGKEAARRGTCQNNLKNIGTALRLFAQENDGYFPPAAHARGQLCDNYSLTFMWQGDLVVPEYLSDPAQNICPSDKDGPSHLAEGGWHFDGNPANSIAPCRIDGRSYNYYGWTFTQETYTKPGTDPNAPGITDAASAMAVVNMDAVETVVELSQAVDAATSREQARALVDQDIAIPGATAFRLRLGVESKVYPGDPNAEARIVVQHDTISSREGDFNHEPGGVNALYMDGHVDFIKFPGEFPAQRAWYILMGTV